MATNALELIGRIPHARPVWEYDEAVGQDICERLIEGESLKAICSDPDMPSRTVVYGWLQEHSAFANNYARARRLQADTFADEIQEVAKNLAILPEHKRVMIDAMKWRAARQSGLLDNCLAADPPEDADPIIATWAKNDLFFLLVYVLGRRDADNDWVFERCREVQASPDGFLDLWAREHYKSTVITFAQTIRDILNDPEITVGIFSHTRPLAKGFLRQIKQELEQNERLKALYPDILWGDPINESPKWSEDEGITVKRKSNPKEATVEAWGVVDGQPTGKHFSLLIYDDIVTENSVGTPEMMTKTTDRLANSYNLGTRTGARRFIGTRYHFNDTYKTVIDRGTAKPRIYAATEEGTVGGTPVFLTYEELAEKRSDQGPYIYSCQMLQNPVADELQGFREEWLKFASFPTTRGLNLVILVDPASRKKPPGAKMTNDYTSMWLIGLGADKNAYVVDMVRSRLKLTERADQLFQWHRRYQPMAVIYEEYGMQADVEHYEDRMERENYRFNITRVGGMIAKNDRIRRLVPWFEKGRIFLPPKLEKKDHEGRRVDLVQSFIREEYVPFPVGLHDDMLDALARLLEPDIPIAWPLPLPDNDEDEEEFEATGRNPVTGY
jgi:predicted phage terminase large subunit-like protein